MTFADQVLTFYKSLRITSPLPEEVVVMNPFQDDESFQYCSEFYRKFYGDNNERFAILGINPGRHGGGITGIPFTDPIKLENFCGIQNPFKKKPELSADFIYKVIDAFGGPEKFYGKFYFSAISPLGFTKGGRNLNYYDIRELQDALKSFIVDAMRKQIAFGINTTYCFCLGEGENLKYLSKLNTEYKFFEKVIPLSHPRFVMQYRRKRVDEYVSSYIEKLSQVSHA